jgi:cytochrome P450
LDAAFRWLRNNQPLGRAELPGFDPFWIVSKHADIRSISAQPRLFGSSQRPAALMSKTAEALVRDRTGGLPNRFHSLLSMDAPDHLDHRGLTQAWFAHSNIRRMQTELQALSELYVAQLEGRAGECDFAAEVAAAYPFQVIMKMLGVPQADEANLRRITDAILASSDETYNPAIKDLPQGSRTETIDRSLNEAVREFAQYFMSLSEQRREVARDDLTSILANATIGDLPLRPREATGYFTLIVLAGYDTTAFSIAAGMQVLCEQPPLLERLQSEPDLIDGFVDECIRWATPARHFMRTALEDTSLRGREIRAGEWLMLCYPSGNRDDEVFEAPFEFRPQRTPNPHLAFGHGAHKCLGLHLARLEMSLLWKALVKRLSRVELAGTPIRSQSTFISGLKSLPIRFTLR